MPNVIDKLFEKKMKCDATKQPKEKKMIDDHR